MAKPTPDSDDWVMALRGGFPAAGSSGPRGSPSPCDL